MGGGKSRRHTAKTGDKSLYKNNSINNKQRATTATQSQIVERHSNRKSNHNADDLIYDPVDQFHNQEYLRLDHDMEDDDDDVESDDGMAEEAVMRLDDNDDDDDDEEEEEEEEEDGDDSNDSQDEVDEEEEEEEEDEPIFSSDDDNDDDDDKNNDVRDWGIKKTAYYYGDTADLEIGQEVEEALLEEDAAKDVLQARYQDMTEDDFMVDDETQNDPHHTLQDNVGQTATTTSAVNMSLSRLLQLSNHEKRQLLNQKHHNEFVPLLSYFTQKMIVPYTSTTLKATNAIFNSDQKENDDNDPVENTAESIGATKLGQQYLLSKAMIQSSAALNLVMYLLLKAEQAANSGTNMVDTALIQSHPVMQHLEKLNSLNSKLEEGVEQCVQGLTEQLETLAKAADYFNDPTSLDQDSEDSDSGDGDTDDDNDAEDMEHEVLANKDVGSSKMLSDNVATSESDDDDDDNDAASMTNENIARRMTLNEARFGLRPNEIQNLRPTMTERRHNKMMQSDAGDDDDVDDDIQRKKSGQSLATTLNTIEQRISTNHKRSKRSSQQMVEHIDDPNDDDDDGELRRGLAMMEEALGAPSDDDDDEKNEQYDPELDDQDDYDNGSEDFYSKMMKKSKATKDERKQRYAVAPKFPRVENDVMGDRTASKQILKNRGLVAHKAKINRNPRVKHREKFRKANIRRSGTVQAIRSPSEGDRYGGEATGISTNVVRSRKLA